MEINIFNPGGPLISLKMMALIYAAAAKSAEIAIPWANSRFFESIAKRMDRFVPLLAPLGSPFSRFYGWFKFLFKVLMQIVAAWLALELGKWLMTSSYLVSVRAMSTFSN